MTAWRWVGARVAYAIHDRQLAEHGGLAGVRDPGAILSALARPENLAAHAQPDAAELAASYACGLARNHGFIDGNTRTAWVVARVFLADNGHELRFDRAAAVRVVECVATGELKEPDLSIWFRARLTLSESR